MKILVICDAGVSVPPTTYGGTERAADLLCRGLASRGHQVDLIAGSGSWSYGGKLFLHKPPTTSRVSRAYRKIRFQLLALKAARSSDVVICFGRTDYLWALYATKLPLIIRFGNLVDQSTIDQIANYRKDRIALVGVSHNQMQNLQSEIPVHVIHNAIDPKQYSFHSEASSPPYLAFLGRLTRNKGIDLAIEAATRIGMPLRIAGNVPDSEPGAREFFESEVEPRLGGDIEWIGPVGDKTKNELLGGATALLFPIQWPEPFANVIVESLACGCPVIGWNHGCVPEAITHGRTGYVVNSMPELLQAVLRAKNLDRQQCRDEVKHRFSSENLVDQSVELMDGLIRCPLIPGKQLAL